MADRRGGAGPARAAALQAEAHDIVNAMIRLAMFAVDQAIAAEVSDAA